MILRVFVFFKSHRFGLSTETLVRADLQRERKLCYRKN